MSNIWDLDSLELLESFFARVNGDVLEIMEGMETVINSSSVTLESIYITGDWGNINREAEDGSRVETYFFLDVEGVSAPSQTGRFVETFTPEYEEGANIITARDWEEGPESLVSILGTPEINAVGADNKSGQLNRILGRQEGNTVFNLTEKVAIEQQEGVSFSNLNRIPLAVLRGEEEPEPEEEEEPEDEEEPEEEERPEEVFEETPDFPEVPPPLRDYAKSSTELEVTVGRKDTKTVEVRDMYDFEIIAATDRPNPAGVPFQAPTEIQSEVMDDIGIAIARGELGASGPLVDTKSPATYPRTGVYIRNYLKFEGISYPLELHKELLTYTAYINGIHDFKLRTGTYDSMRRYISAINKLGDMGLELIEEVPQQALASRGLSKTPDHPTIDGAKAPFLESKRYYTLVEENEDHPAWRDVFSFLEEMEEDGE